MGQKVSPHGLRVGIIKDWDSRWFASKKEYNHLVYEDYKIREFLKNKLFQAGVSKIEIERSGARIRIHVHCSKPGIVIGKGGAEIDKLKAELEKRLKGRVYVKIVEVKFPDCNAQLIAESVAFQLERRISFRRAMKQSISRAMVAGVKGIKIRVAGRLGGAEIARDEVYYEGTIPLQTLRADIDYGFSEAKTTYGRIGVKVWVYNGEVLKKQADGIDSDDMMTMQKAGFSNRKDGNFRRDGGGSQKSRGFGFRSDRRVEKVETNEETSERR